MQPVETCHSVSRLARVMHPIFVLNHAVTPCYAKNGAICRQESGRMGPGRRGGELLGNARKVGNDAPSRRSFLNLLLGGSALTLMGAIFYPVAFFLRPPKESTTMVSSVSAGRLSDYAPDSSKIVRFGRIPVIVVRKADGEFRAFSATCTHLDCTVQYRRDMGVIWCACHNGKYDLEGRNIAGPPPRPLEEFRVDVENDEVFVTRIA